jgi:hypothetical protein
MKFHAMLPRFGRLTRSVVLTLLIVGPVLVVSYLVFIDGVFSHAVPRAEELGFRPSVTPQRAAPERQTEAHTCGLHCLRSLYRAHGLDPEEHALRFRLGVDRGAVPAMDSTEGTLQPDLTRVLAQDGFLVREVEVGAATGAADLKEHLGESWFALALIRRLANGHLHWVLLQEGSTPEGVGMVDSLRESPQDEETGAFLRRQAVSVFLVEPNHGEVAEEIKRAHRLGVSAMKRTPARMRELEAINGGDSGP